MSNEDFEELLVQHIDPYGSVKLPLNKIPVAIKLDMLTGAIRSQQKGTMDAKHVKEAIDLLTDDPLVPMHDDSRALHEAVFWGHDVATEILLKKGAKPSDKDLFDIVEQGLDGWLEAGQDYPKTVAALLNAKINPNAIIDPSDGTTPLHAVADAMSKDYTHEREDVLKSHLGMARELISHGGSVLIPNKEGKTALDMITNDHPKALRALFENAAKAERAKQPGTPPRA